MQFPAYQVERFYHIWFPLLHYVNEQRHLTSFQRFVRFLVETGRMDYHQAGSLRDFLKHAKE